MNPRLLLVSATAFLLMLGLGVLFPVLPYFMRWLGLSEFDAGVMMSSYALASVVMAPVWGRFSERYGRKPALLIGLVGFALGYALFGLGSTYWQLLGARVLGGVLAAAALPATLAYTADITPPAERSAALGTVGAAFGLGVLAGPVIGGWLGDYDYRLPFFATAVIGSVAALGVAIGLPESLTDEIRAGARRHRESLAERGLGLPRIAAALAPLLVYSLLVQTGRTGLESTIGFLVEDRFSGGPSSTGYLLGAAGLVAVLVQGAAIRPLSRRYTDQRLLLTGTALLALGLAGLGFAGSWATLVATSLVVGAGSALLTPTFTAVLSRSAESVQGEAQGLNASAQSLGRAVGPLVFTSLYQSAGTVLPYLTAAVLCAAALAVAGRGLGASLPGR